MKIIILNGPPRSGKDELAKHLAATAKYQHIKFANELKRMVHRAYNTVRQEADAYELVKDVPLDEFGGLTPREAYIAFSERYIKPTHGVRFFGYKLVEEIKRLNKHGDDIFIASDGGFDEELMPLLQSFNPSLVTVLQLHRKGCNFDIDSRSYLDKSKFEPQGVRFLTMHNDGDCLDPYLEEAAQLLKMEPLPC